MILHQECYVEFIQGKGVGKNDRVASSLKSYVSYLNGVARLLKRDITPDLLRSDSDVETVARRLEGQRKSTTIDKYKVAMRHYVAMVQELGLKRARTVRVQVTAHPSWRTLRHQIRGWPFAL